MNIPLANKKYDSLFLLLVYEQYPSNIFMIPNNSNIIGIIILLLMILNKPKSDNIITTTAINVFTTLNLFKLVPPIKIITDEFFK